MTAKVYDLFKQTNPRIVDYRQNRSGADDPNAKVTVQFACSKEHQESLEKFIKACNEELDEDTAEIVGSSATSIFFRVVSDYDFSNKLVKDFF